MPPARGPIAEWSSILPVDFSADTDHQIQQKHASFRRSVRKARKETSPADVDVEVEKTKPKKRSLSPVDEVKAARARRVIQARAFYAWLGLVRSIKSRKARLVTQWMLAVKHWQSNTLKWTFETWTRRQKAVQETKRIQHRATVHSALLALRAHTHRTAAHVAQFRATHLLSSAIRVWKRRTYAVLDRRLELRAAGQACVQVRERTLMTCALRAWKTRLEMERSVGALTSLREGNVLRERLLIWQIATAASCCRRVLLQRYQAAIARRHWLVWVAKFNEANRQRQIAAKATIRGIFSRWRGHASRMASLRARSLAFRSQILIQRRASVLSKWQAATKQKLVLSRRCNAFQVRLAVPSRGSAFLHWRAIFAVATKVKGMEEIANAKRTEAVRRSLLTIWRRAAQLRGLLRRKARDRLVGAVAVWQRRYHTVGRIHAALLVNADADRKVRDKARVLERWHAVLRRKREARVYAERWYDVHAARGVIRLWKTAWEVVERRERMAREAVERRNERLCLRYWYHSASVRIERRNTELVESFRDSVVRRLIRDCLEALKFNQRQRHLCRQVSLAKREQLLDAMKLQAFRTWQARCQVNNEMELIAAERHNKLYMSQVWWMWMLKTKTSQRLHRASAVLRRWHCLTKLQAAFTGWQTVAVATRDLRVRYQRVAGKIKRTKLEIVLTTWRLALRYKRLKQKQETLVDIRIEKYAKECFTGWRTKFLGMRAERQDRALATKRFFEIWRGQRQSRIHDVLATGLHQRRVCGVLFRIWLWKTWGDIAPDSIVEVLRAENGAGPISPSRFLNDVALRSRYIPKPIPEDVEQFQRLDRVGRILATTDVQTAIYADAAAPLLDDGSGPSRARWRASVIRLRAVTRKRRGEYAAADAGRAERLLSEAFKAWWRRQKAASAFRKGLEEMEGARHRASLMQSFVTWRSKTTVITLDRAKAVQTSDLALKRTTLAHWMALTRHRSQDMVNAHVASRLASTMQHWHLWRTRMATHAETRKAVANEILAHAHRRRSLLSQSLSALMKLWRAHAAGLASARASRSRRVMVRCVNQWMARTSMRRFEHHAEAAAVKHRERAEMERVAGFRAMDVYRDASSLSHLFRRWRSRTRNRRLKYETLTTTLTKSRRRISTPRYFRKWVKRRRGCEEREETAACAYENELVSKAFAVWKRAVVPHEERRKEMAYHETGPLIVFSILLPAISVSSTIEAEPPPTPSTATTITETTDARSIFAASWADRMLQRKIIQGWARIPRGPLTSFLPNPVARTRHETGRWGRVAAVPTWEEGEDGVDKGRARVPEVRSTVAAPSSSASGMGLRAHAVVRERGWRNRGLF
ncbi:hypothetical protein HKX48_004737 [Thoreauomyces humboldtii]|nr:hypothetical protein HKX48_004737 [Thoreauomyces humboldtii]